jgi:hypothetical protein
MRQWVFPDGKFERSTSLRGAADRMAPAALHVASKSDGFRMPCCIFITISCRATRFEALAFRCGGQGPGRLRYLPDSQLETRISANYSPRGLNLKGDLRSPSTRLPETTSNCFVILVAAFASLHWAGVPCSPSTIAATIQYSWLRVSAHQPESLGHAFCRPGLLCGS